MNYINTYKDINMTSEILGSSPYRHITLLLERLLQNIQTCLLAIAENNISLKCKLLKNSHDIIDYFLNCLDFEADPVMSKQLERLYQHTQRLIFWANAKNDPNKLDEAKIIIENISIWWSKISDSQN